MKTLEINQKREQNLFSKKTILFTDDIINDLNENSESKSNYSQTNTSVLANLYEFEDEYELDLLAPGVEKNDIEIDIDNDNMLTVYAEISKELNENITNFQRQEFINRGFKRSFQLPINTIPEDISAVYKNGIISLYIPKKEELEINETIDFVII
jgi:HSP20 family protein